MTDPAIKFIALYLPQFHPIPENDRWWGEGFTEWTNVRKAKPLYKGHFQPHVPSDLGYYDLREGKAREDQASLAKEYGIYGFCYWHYWFGNGKRLLELPAKEVLKNGEPEFPFCFAWANQTWTGIWHGLDNKILIKQDYPGIDDDIQHFYEVLPYFRDTRYIRKNNKPVFVLYRPFDHPHLDKFVATWKELAVKEGLEGVHFVGWAYEPDHFFECLDAFIINEFKFRYKKIDLLDKVFMKFMGKYRSEWISTIKYNCYRYSFKEMIKHVANEPLEDNEYPCVLTGWDNTPRSGKNGRVFYDFSAELFGEHLRKTLKLIGHRSDTFVFIKSWNEWAEGNYLEPDTKFQKKKLEILKSVSEEFNKRTH